MTLASTDEVNQTLHYKIRGVVHSHTPGQKTGQQKRGVSAAKPESALDLACGPMDQTQQALDNSLSHGARGVSGEGRALIDGDRLSPQNWQRSRSLTHGLQLKSQPCAEQPSTETSRGRDPRQAEDGSRIHHEQLLSTA